MKFITLPLIFIGFSAFAQPDAERISQVRHLNELMQENQLSLSCERKVQGEKSEIQFFPFENRLITTITVTKGKTGWSAQNDILGLKLAKTEGENTHLKLGFVQRGPEKLPAMHLQMQMSEETIMMTRQERRLKPSFKAYEKNSLNQPFTCRFYGQRVQ